MQFIELGIATGIDYSRAFTSVSFAPGAQAAHALAGLRPHHLDRLAEPEPAPQIVDVDVAQHDVGSVGRRHPFERREPERPLLLGGLPRSFTREPFRAAAADKLVEGFR